MLIDSVELTRALVRRASVTPADQGAQDILIKVLEGLGFSCTKLKFGEIENFFARKGSSGPHLCFAGHTDVVPSGDEAAWSSPPFAAELRDGKIIGRGTSDMKGNIAAFVAALSRADLSQGSVSLLITGDEEGPAVDGTVKVLEWMKDHGHVPDACIVGEPSNPEQIGDEIKIGRRGSLSGTITVLGKQGHVAYPERTDNPIPKLARMIDAITSAELDDGTEYFQPSSLQVVNVHVGNTVDNIVPAAASARFNVRFNNLWTAETLEAEIREILNLVNEPYTLECQCGAESFMTEPGAFTELVVSAVAGATGKTPALSTGGGTSDARFVEKYCPVVELGLINKTIHQVDEFVLTDDLRLLEHIYADIIEKFLHQ